MDIESLSDACQSRPISDQSSANVASMDWVSSASLDLVLIEQLGGCDLEEHRPVIELLLAGGRRALGSADPFRGLDFAEDATVLLLRALVRVVELNRRLAGGGLGFVGPHLLDGAVGMHGESATVRSMVGVG